jgi:hypothetical protein
MKHRFDEPIRTLDASVAELQQCLTFIERAAAARPRLGRALDWKSSDKGAISLAQEFIDEKDFETGQVALSIHVSAVGVFERFLRSLTSAMCEHVGTKKLSEKTVNANIALTGRLLATVNDPPDQMHVDYAKVIESLAGRNAHGDFLLCAQAFSLQATNASPDTVERVFDGFGFNLNWDSLAKRADAASLLGTTGVRESSNELKNRLASMVRLRNRVAHGDERGATLTLEELKVSLRLIRSLAKALAEEAHVSLSGG